MVVHVSGGSQCLYTKLEKIITVQVNYNNDIVNLSVSQKYTRMLELILLLHLGPYVSYIFHLGIVAFMNLYLQL